MREVHPLGGCCCGGGTCGDGKQNCNEQCDGSQGCSSTEICVNCMCESSFCGAFYPNCKPNGSACTKNDGSRGACMSLPGSSCQYL